MNTLRRPGSALGSICKKLFTICQATERQGILIQPPSSVIFRHLPQMNSKARQSARHPGAVLHNINHCSFLLAPQDFLPPRGATWAGGILGFFFLELEAT
jgi:hypothetical protein